MGVANAWAAALRPEGTSISRFEDGNTEWSLHRSVHECGCVRSQAAKGSLDSRAHLPRRLIRRDVWESRKFNSGVAPTLPN